MIAPLLGFLTLLLPSLFLLAAPVAKPKILIKPQFLPRDHLDSVKLESDGHLNRDYRREIFFGENHDEIVPKNKEEMDQVIKDLFNKMDFNRNNELETTEISDWILLNIQSHLKAAKLLSEAAFKHLDKNNNNLVSWDEFLKEYLLASGYDSSIADKYVQDHDVIKLSEKDEVNLANCRHSWSSSDDDFDSHLNSTEFLSFRHPELRRKSQLRMARQLITSLDKNNDGKLTEAEFSKPLDDPDVVVEVPFPGMENNDDKWYKERLKQFREHLDENHDGVASEIELANFVQPDSRHNIVIEVEDLMSKLDRDKSGTLNLEELLARGQDIIGSQMVNVAAKMHEDL